MRAEIETLAPIAHEMADAAREVILPFFRSRGLESDNKETSGFDPVTEADRAAERVMRGVLERHRPNDTVIGEEYGTTQGTSGLTWVLDPIDGTRGFISGTPTWGVLIAAGPSTGPELGLIDQPYIGERFIGFARSAEAIGPAGRHAIKTRPPRPLSDAILYSTFPEIGTQADKEAFDCVAEHVKLVRYGMDCYAYALLAAGQIDLVIEAGLQNYDIQAPIALIRAAGGVVTNWEGSPAHMGGRVIAAANADIHEKALRLLTRATPKS